MFNKGNRRKTGKEQYYTSATIVDTCVSILLSATGKDYLFIEPAGGTGAFIEGLQRQGVNNIVSFDIEPKHKLVLEQNFLEITEPPSEPWVCISNPPFGRANSLSKKFFNHAAELNAEYIGFLIPKSWRKWSIQNSLSMQYHLVKDIDLPANCFETADGKPYGNTGGLTCIFQIWKRYKKGQRTPIKIEDRGYIRKCKPEEADTAIVVFGWGCGKVEYEFERKPNTTKMYLCTKNKKIRRTLSELDYKQFYKNTAYIPALSLQEINHLLNERINK